MINGSEKGLQTPIFDLSRRPEGDVFEDLPIDYKNLPQWLRKESNWLYDRNIEINDIVTFLIGTKRLLTVVGEQSSGRTAVITKAIKIVMARNGSKFRDGVFEVDLENIGMPSIIKKISDTLGLSNPFPKEDSLIRDLIKKDLLIVFTDCQMTSRKKTQLEILKLI
jgi:ABC-type dipeptide/oligopeptide/nickel transport system ATPase component